MGDMGDIFNTMKRDSKERRNRNLQNAMATQAQNWTIRCSTQWARKLLGDTIDYWPARHKCRWRGKTMTGDVEGFIRNRERANETVSKDG